MSQLERRYFVLKWKDLEAAGLTPEQRDNLQDIANSVGLARARRGKPPLESVVIESDWPEYAEVVSRVLTRDRLT